MKPTIVSILLLASCVYAQAPSTDWGDCQDELDRARRVSSDASDAAEKVKATLDEFQKCRRDPEAHDLLGDGCRARRSDYESALSDFRSEMDTLDSRLRSVQTSCSYEFTINRMSGLQAADAHAQGAEARL